MAGQWLKKEDARLSEKLEKMATAVDEAIGGGTDLLSLVEAKLCGKSAIMCKHAHNGHCSRNPQLI